MRKNASGGCEWLKRKNPNNLKEIESRAILPGRSKQAALLPERNRRMLTSKQALAHFL
jgi:hypothetical protein